jgi:hypothetical protein
MCQIEQLEFSFEASFHGFEFFVFHEPHETSFHDAVNASTLHGLSRGELFALFRTRSL